MNSMVQRKRAYDHERYMSDCDKYLSYSKTYALKHRQERKQYQHDWYINNKEHATTVLRKNHLKRKYNISVKQYEQLLASQKQCCAICRSVPLPSARRLAVDHHHSSKKIRGLLCAKCNIGLGYFNDSIQLLSSAIKYLQGD